VPSYRIYFLNKAGHIVRACELACMTDEEAVAETQKQADAQTVELWDRARLIARFEAAT
jgi:HJR/Mrr/RecB family endonuclease